MKNLNRQSWPALAAGLYAAAVLVWMPWYAGGYVQITQEKLSAFLGVTLLAGLLLAVVAPEKMRATRWKQQGKAAVLYAAATLVSVLLSGNIVAALWASGGYLGGLVLVAAALLGCMGTAVFLEDADSLALPFMVSGAGVTLLGIVNNFGADPLGFRAVIEPSQYNLFFSTIGNADYLSAYLCLWLPLALHRFAAGKSAGERTAAFLCTELGFFGMASLDSGLAALGLAGAAFLLLLTVPLTAGELARYALLAGGWAAAQLAMGVLSTRWPLLRTEHPFAALAQPLPAAAIIAVCLAAAALWAECAKRNPSKTSLTAQRLCCVAAAMLTAALLVAVNGFGVSLGGLDNFLRVGPDWATGRGAIWADVWYCFTRGTPQQMLFGHGPGMVHAALAGLGDTLPFAAADTIGAHNEYLELLLTGGVVGLAAYLTFLATVLYTARQNLAADPQKCGWLFCALAYAVQATFNNRVSAVYPVFLVLLGVLTAAPQQRTKRRHGLVPAGLLLLAGGAGVGRLLLRYLFL